MKVEIQMDAKMLNDFFPVFVQASVDRVTMY